jgi:hypothetical protein
MTAAWLVLALLPAQAPAGPDAAVRRGDSTARLALDAAEVRLSGSLRLTLLIEGPAPVRVEALPNPLIPGGAWSARPLGGATTESAGPGRERWRQAFRVEPQRPGDPVPLAPGPLRFRAGGAVAETAIDDWPALAVRVRTEVQAADPGDLRPVTGVEPAPRPASGPRWALWLGLALVPGLAAAAGLTWLVLRRRKPRPPTPAEAALAALGRWEANLNPDGGAVSVEAAAALAGLLRGYVAARFGVSAPKRTTAELLARLAAEDRPDAAARGLLGEVLARCDLARFAGLPLSPDEGRALAGQARRFITDSSASPAEPPAQP